MAHVGERFQVEQCDCWASMVGPMLPPDPADILLVVAALLQYSQSIARFGQLRLVTSRLDASTLVP